MIAKYSISHIRISAQNILEEVLKEELVQSERMPSSHVSLHVTTNQNVMKSHAKRGLDHVDRLSSAANGKRGVARDVWVPTVSNSQTSGRAEHYRPPSAMSDTGSLCVPEFENSKDSKPQCSIRF